MSPPRADAHVRLRFPDEAVARAVHEALRLDNEGFVETDQRGREITAHASADSLASLLRTLDDLLAAASAAERAADAARDA